MKKYFYKTGICLVSLTLSLGLYAHTVKYSELEGARRIGDNNKFWEVGWVPSHYKTNPVKYPVKDLKGVWFKKYGDTKTGNRIITATELGVKPSQGVKLPMLGINGDFYVSTHRNVECPTRFYGDDGKIAYAYYSRGPYFYFYTGEPADWYNSGCTVKKRHKALDNKVYGKMARAVLFDSRWLDTDRDGRWKAEKLFKIRSYSLPMTLKYVMLLPATTVDIPMKSSWRNGAKISFEYATEKGTEKASFLLDPEYIPKSGVLRIGFVGEGHNNKCNTYIVQNPGRGKEGLIIGKIPVFNGRLQIKPGTLKITTAKWMPYDRIAADKRKIIGKESSSKNEFEAFDRRKFAGWGYVRLDPQTHFAGIASPKINPYTNIRRKAVSQDIIKKLNAGVKYGMRVAILASTEPTQSIYIPDKYKTEVLDPKTDKFVKGMFLDWTNKEAVAWEADNLRHNLSLFKGIPSYALVHEGIGRFRVSKDGNMSKHALASFRNFTGNPKALFPADITTTRTTANASQRLKRQYHKWLLGYYRGHKLMLGVLKPAYEALEGGRFRGIGYFGGTWENDDGAITYLAQAPETVFLCAENVRGKDDRRFKSWRKIAKKNLKRIELLPHSYPYLVTKSTKHFIKWFEDLAELPEVDGLLLGGGGQFPTKLFEALAAKHFGKGRMNPKEADRIIKILKQKGIFYLEKSKVK